VCHVVSARLLIMEKGIVVFISKAAGEPSEGQMYRAAIHEVMKDQDIRTAEEP
jgi:hypothetical protein